MAMFFLRSNQFLLLYAVSILLFSNVQIIHAGGIMSRVQPSKSQHLDWTNLPLHRLCAEGTAMLKDMDDQNVNSVDSNGFTPLHVVLGIRDLKFSFSSQSLKKGIIANLLDKGADVAKCDNYGFTCLDRAFFEFDEHKKDMEDVIRSLISHTNGGGINLINENGDTALHKAINLSRIPRIAIGERKFIIENILYFGADPNILNRNGDTPLTNVLQGSHSLNDKKELVNFLLLHGAQINKQDNNGETVFHKVLQSRNSKEDKIGLINFLVELNEQHHIDINKANNDGNTPLHNLVSSSLTVEEKEPIINLLLNKGASVNQANIWGETPLHNLVSSSLAVEEKKPIINLLLTSGANINQSDNIGDTPLHNLVSSSIPHEEKVPIIKLLLDHHAQIDKVNDADDTPFDIVVDRNVSSRKKEQILDLLLIKGVDVNKPNNDGYTPLHKLVLCNIPERIPLLRLFIIKHACPNLNCKTREGNTPLHLVLLSNLPLEERKKMVELLLEKGADIFEKNDQNESPVEIAIARLKNHPDEQDIVRLLVDSSGVTMPPLHRAVRDNNDGLVVFLIQNGALVNDPDSNGWSPLYWAIKNKNLNLIDLLLRNGANFQSFDNQGYTPIHYAVSDNDPKLVECLITKYGVNINQQTEDGRSLLYVAVEKKLYGVVKFLLQKQQGLPLADINLSDKRGYTPLHQAVQDNDGFMVDMLLNYGAKVYFDDGDDSDGEVRPQTTPLHLAAMNNNLEIAGVLIGAIPVSSSRYSRRRFINTRDEKKLSALYHACACNNRFVANFLIEKGADLGVSDEYGYTPFHVAAYAAGVPLVKDFLDKGADKEVKSVDSFTALLCALQGKNEDVARFLIYIAQSDIRAETIGGMNALHIAAKYGYKKFVETLLNNKINVNSRTIEGITPLHNAVMHGDLDLVRYLVANGACITKRNYLGMSPFDSACDESDDGREIKKVLTAKHIEQEAQGVSDNRDKEEEILDLYSEFIKLKLATFMPKQHGAYPEGKKIENVIRGAHKYLISHISTYLNLGMPENISNSIILKDRENNLLDLFRYYVTGDQGAYDYVDAGRDSFFKDQRLEQRGEISKEYFKKVLLYAVNEAECEYNQNEADNQKTSDSEYVRLPERSEHFVGREQQEAETVQIDPEMKNVIVLSDMDPEKADLILETSANNLKGLQAEIQQAFQDRDKIARGEQITSVAKDGSETLWDDAPSFKRCILYGAPGTGKTSWGRALARATGARCMVIHCASLTTKFQGSAPKRLNQAFDYVIERINEENKPYIIILDEIDKTDPKHYVDGRGNAPDGIAVINSFIDRFSDPEFKHKNDIVLVATTNYLEVLPENTKGKFGEDDIYKVTFPDEEKRKMILTAYMNDAIETKKWLQPDCYTIIDQLVSHTYGFSCRRIEQTFYNEIRRFRAKERDKGSLQYRDADRRVKMPAEILELRMYRCSLGIAGRVNELCKAGAEWFEKRPVISDLLLHGAKSWIGAIGNTLGNHTGQFIYKKTTPGGRYLEKREGIKQAERIRRAFRARYNERKSTEKQSSVTTQESTTISVVVASDTKSVGTSTTDGSNPLPLSKEEYKSKLESVGLNVPDDLTQRQLADLYERVDEKVTDKIAAAEYQLEKGKNPDTDKIWDAKELQDDLDNYMKKNFDGDEIKRPEGEHDNRSPTKAINEML